VSLPDPISAMLAPSFYPKRPHDVSLVQTHISYVLLAGDEVYKVKKAVRFSFLDFSTLEKRRHFCHEEVRLNRRLASDVYLGVVSICREGDSYRLGMENDPSAVEYAVHMRRLEADRLLVNLLARGAATAEMIDAVAARVAAFHEVADSGPAVTANGAPEAIRAVLGDNFDGVRPFRDKTIPARDDDDIRSFCLGFLDEHPALFARRQAEHRIRDCHGDLHAEHVYVGDPIVIFDCIEFNRQFRYCDVASEIAFLAMDLDFRDHPGLARRLVWRYAELAADRDIERLVPFYSCYRAYVRGKVDSLKSAEEEVGEDERARARRGAGRHFALAYRYTWAYTPALAVIFGLSGSGKSTLAAALRARTGFTHFNSDVIRKELAGLPPTARGGPELYTPERSAATYGTMLARAGEELAAGRGAIIDATFQRREHRDTVRALAAQERVPLLFVECSAGNDVIRRRLDERAKREHSPSDADWDVYLQQRAVYEPFAADEPGAVLRADTARPQAELLASIEKRLRQLCRR
jgi:aminoglycoside phosphotransferase family enzyme/predicted kinase